MPEVPIVTTLSITMSVRSFAIKVMTMFMRMFYSKVLTVKGCSKEMLYCTYYSQTSMFHCYKSKSRIRYTQRHRFQ